MIVFVSCVENERKCLAKTQRILQIERVSSYNRYTTLWLQGDVQKDE